MYRDTLSTMAAHCCRREEGEKNILIWGLILEIKLEGKPPGKTRLLLEEVLVRPAGGAQCSPCGLCGSQHPGIVMGTHYTVKKHCLSDETLN